MPGPLPTPQIVGGSMPSRAVGQESEGIFTFNYSGQGLLSIQTSLNGTDWHPGSAISIQGGTPSYTNWTVGSQGYQPFSVIRITPSVSGTTVFYVRIQSVLHNTFSNVWQTSLTSFVASAGGYLGGYARGKNESGTDLKRLNTFQVDGVAVDGATTKIYDTFVTGTYGTSLVETQNQTRTVGGSYPHLIVRYDNAGNVLWSRRMVFNHDMQGFVGELPIVQDEAGNLYLLVLNFTLLIGDTDTAEQHVGAAPLARYLVKLGPQGQFLWARTLIQPDTGSKSHMAVGGSVLAIWTNRFNLVTYEGVHTANPTNSHTSKVLLAVSVQDGTLLWSKTYNPTSAKGVDNDSVSVNNYGYVAVHHYSDTAGGDWEGVAMPTYATTSKFSVFNNTGSLLYTTGVLQGGASTPFFNAGSMYLKRSSSNLFVGIFNTGSATSFRVPDLVSHVTVQLPANYYARLELGTTGLGAAKQFSNVVQLAVSPSSSRPVVDLGLGISSPWVNVAFPALYLPYTDSSEVSVLQSRRVGDAFPGTGQALTSIAGAQFDQYGNAYVTHGTFQTAATQFNLFFNLDAAGTSSSPQPANLLNTASRNAWGALVGYPVDNNPPSAPGQTEPPVRPICPAWPASVPEGQSASGVITGFDPEGLAATTTGQGVVTPVLQIWNPTTLAWVDDPAQLVIPGFGTISSSNSGFLNIGSTVTFSPETLTWYGILAVICRWKVGARVSALNIFFTTVVNTAEPTDPPAGEMPNIFEGEISEGTYAFTVDPDNKASYTWELSPQHTKPANWDTLYPPAQYPNGQPDWHTTIGQTVSVVNNQNEVMGEATVLSTNHPQKSAVLRYTSLPGKTGTAKFDVRVSNGTPSLWVTVTVSVQPQPTPTFLSVSFPTVSESSYSQATLSFSHVDGNGQNLPAGSVSYTYEFASDAGKPDNWDTLYPPANYPNGQPPWPVDWAATCQAIDEDDHPVGLVNVQSEDDDARTAVIRYTPIQGFVGYASFDLRVKATWAPIAGTRPLAVVRYSAVKSSTIQIVALETPGSPSGTMPNCNEDSTSTGTWTFTYQAQAALGYSISWQLSPQTDKPANWDTLYPPAQYPYGQPDWHSVTGTSITVLNGDDPIGTAVVLSEDDALKKATLRYTPAANYNGNAEFDVRVQVTWPVSAQRPIQVTKSSPWVTAHLTVVPQPDSPVLLQPTAPAVTEDTPVEFNITWTDPDKTPAQIAQDGGDGYTVILNTTGSGVGTESGVITLSKAIVRVMSYSPDSLQATLRVEPLANQTGTVSVYIRIKDDEVATRFSSYRTVTFNIIAVPDAPSPVQGTMPFALNGQSVSGTFSTTDPDSTYSHFVIASSVGGPYVKSIVAGALTLNVVDTVTTDRQCQVVLLQTAAHSLTSYGFYIRAYDVNSSNYLTGGGLYSTPVFVQGQIGSSGQGSDTGGGGQSLAPGPSGNGASGIWGPSNGGTHIFPAAAGATSVTRLAPFSTITALSVIDSLDGSGSCEMVVSAAEVALRAAQANKTVESYLRAGAVEITVNIGGSTFFVGPIVETAWETNSGVVRISARGLLSYFENRILPRATAFVTRNLSDMVSDLVMGTQSFGYGDLLITQSVSQVNASATVTFPAGRTIADCLGEILDRVDAPEIWIGPDRVLRAVATRGVDNRSRVRITSGVATVASWTRRNDGVVTVARVTGGPDGNGGVFSGTAGNVSGAQVYGLIEKQYEVGTLLSNGECAALAQRIVDSFNDEVQALQVTMTLNPAMKFFLSDLDIGNVVTLDLVDNTLGPIFGSFRVINRTVTLVDTALSTYEVGLNLEPAKFVAGKLIGSRSRHNPKLLLDSAKADLLLRQA